MNMASGVNQANTSLNWLTSFFGSGAPAVGGQAGAQGAGAAAFGGAGLADGAGFWTTAGSFGSLATAGGAFGTAAAGAFIGSIVSSQISKDPDAGMNGAIGGAVGSIFGAYVAAGTAVGGPWGAIIGAIIGGVLMAFTDMDGPGVRTARVIAAEQFNAAGMTYGMQSALGGLGIQRGSDEWFSDSDMGATLTQWFDAIRGMDNSIAARLSTAQLAAVRTAVGGQNQHLFFGMEGQDINPAAFGAIIKDRYGKLFEAIDPAMGALITGFEGTIGDLMKLIDDLASVNQQLTANAAEFAALFGESIAFTDLQELQKSGETFSQLIRLSAVFFSTNTIALLFGKTQEQVWGAVGLATTGGREQLIQFAGGVENLTRQLGEYYSRYYTEAERSAMTGKQLSASFTGLGLTMPTSLQGFRDLVEAQDLTTESGRKTFAALMALSPTFADFTEQVKGLDGVMYDAAAAVATHRDLWEQFATPAQKLAQATLEVDAGFQRLGLSVPKSREEMANLIAGIDTSTESGRQLVAALRLLAPALGIVLDKVMNMVTRFSGIPSIPNGVLNLPGNNFSTFPLTTYTPPSPLRRDDREFVGGPDGEQQGISAYMQWLQRVDVLMGRRTQREIDRERDLASAGDDATRVLINQYYAQLDANDATRAAAEAMARAKNEMLDFGAAMDKLHGNNAYSTQFAQWNAAGSMASVTAAMPWIKDINQLMTMSMTDFENYSEAHRKLILDALRAAGALRNVGESAAAANAGLSTGFVLGQQPPGWAWTPSEAGTSATGNSQRRPRRPDRPTTASCGKRSRCRTASTSYPGTATRARSTCSGRLNWPNCLPMPSASCRRCCGAWRTPRKRLPRPPRKPSNGLTRSATSRTGCRRRCLMLPPR